MSKAFFRYLRGELNGFYINSIYNTLEKEIKDIKEFFAMFKAQQFELDKMSSNTLFNLGKFASVFLYRKLGDTVSNVHLTESYISEDTEYSERGLYLTEDNKFEFRHVDKSFDDNAEDINTLATDTLRTSLIGSEQIKGYVSEYTKDALRDTGEIKEEAISKVEPQKGAYTDFYGNQFMFLSDTILRYQPIHVTLHYEMFKILQYIRYNGVSLYSFCRIINILCPNKLVQIKSIKPSNDGKCLVVRYSYDLNSEVYLKEQRYFLFQVIIAQKFKQIYLEEIL